MEPLFQGGSRIKSGEPNISGIFVSRDGDPWFRITDFDRMSPFLVALTSGGNHWMFLSSTGGLTCGRKSPEHALFPYLTDDKIHDAGSTTGPLTLIRASRDGRTFLWKPFCREVTPYQLQRNLYKNRDGNQIIFEETNEDLELVFSYRWATSKRFGFVRTAQIRNLSRDTVEIELLDGLRNLLPHGVEVSSQATLSTLIDAYKQAESVPGVTAAIYSLSSILTDRAEPSEALKATVAWSHGLEKPRLLLS